MELKCGCSDTHVETARHVNPDPLRSHLSLKIHAITFDDLYRQQKHIAELEGEEKALWFGPIRWAQANAKGQTNE